MKTLLTVTSLRAGLSLIEFCRDVGEEHPWMTAKGTIGMFTGRAFENYVEPVRDADTIDQKYGRCVRVCGSGMYCPPSKGKSQIRGTQRKIFWHKLVQYCDRKRMEKCKGMKGSKKARNRRSILANQLTKIIADDMVINALHYKCAAKREAQMHRHKYVEGTKNVTNVIWQDEGKISDNYAQYRAKIIETVPELETMWAGHLGQIKTAKPRIELSYADAKPIHSEPYRARPQSVPVPQKYNIQDARSGSYRTGSK